LKFIIPCNINRISSFNIEDIWSIRNILETIKALRVDTFTTVENYVTSDFILGRLNAAIRGAKIVEKKYLSDGVVEVVVEIPMTGILTEALVAQTAALPVPREGEQLYTGLIIDARGLGARPAFSPKILDETGREVYGSSYVSRELLIKQGLVGYAKELADASENERVAENPLVVRGIRTSWLGNSDIIISRTDADILLDTAGNSAFLEECRVIIVLD